MENMGYDNKKVEITLAAIQKIKADETAMKIATEKMYAPKKRSWGERNFGWFTFLMTIVGAIIGAVAQRLLEFL
jgi:hypothetical protein